MSETTRATFLSMLQPLRATRPPLARSDHSAKTTQGNCGSSLTVGTGTSGACSASYCLPHAPFLSASLPTPTAISRPEGCWNQLCKPTGGLSGAAWVTMECSRSPRYFLWPPGGSRLPRAPFGEQPRTPRSGRPSHQGLFFHWFNSTLQGPHWCFGITRAPEEGKRLGQASHQGLFPTPDFPQ